MTEPAEPAAEDAGRSFGGAARRSRMVAAGILSSRLLGLVRVMLLARLAGTGLASDVIAFALRGPNVLQNLLGEQALSASFIPVYSRLLAEGRTAEARRFAGAAFGLLALVAAALGLGLMLIAPAWVTVFAPGFRARPEAFALSVAAVRILFPMTAVLVLSAWCLAVLNSHRRFFLPYFAPALWNLSLVAGLGWLAWRVDDPAPRAVVLTVAVAALIGGVLQFAIQAPAAVRANGGLDPRPSLAAPGVRPALRTFAPALLGRGSVQLSGYVDYLLASLLAAGAIAALDFAQRLYLLPVALFGTAFAVVELPEVSRLDPETGRREAWVRARAAIGQVGFLTVPSAVGFLALGWLVVATMYRGGEFQTEDVWLVYAVLAVYSLGLVASTSSRLVQNLFYAGRDTMTPAKRAMLRVIVQVAVGGGLMVWLDRYRVAGVFGLDDAGTLRLGAVGLAAGSAVAAWVELASLGGALRRRGVAAHGLLPWGRLFRFAALSVLAGAGAGALWWTLRGWPTLPTAAAVLPAFVGLYLASAAALGLPESARFWGRVRGAGEGGAGADGP